MGKEGRVSFDSQLAGKLTMAEKPPQQKQESAVHSQEEGSRKADVSPFSCHTGLQPGNGAPTFRVGLLSAAHRQKAENKISFPYAVGMEKGCAARFSSRQSPGG